jgi:hypothetical protein
MLEYHHAGITYQENSARIDPARASFASLPGELRNLVYSSFLRRRNPISVKYNATTRRFQTPFNKGPDGRTPFEVLELLSNLDHNIRTEARSYFFANNIFQLETKQSSSTDPDYIATYIHFLGTIGDVARYSLGWLRLTVTSDTKSHVPTADQGFKLWDIISECRNLETLDIYAEIDYFYMDQHTALKSYMSTEGEPISNPWSEVLESIQAMPNLRRLILRPLFSSRWRCFDVVEDATPEQVAFGTKEMWSLVRRPMDEATRLTEQVKGYMRRGLRSDVAVNVVSIETWTWYDRDLVVERNDGE